MQLDTSQMIIGMIVIFLGYSIFQTWSLKDKVYCTFRTPDKVLLHKVVSIKSGRVEFLNAWYDLNPKRTSLRMVWQGVIPTWVRCLDYRYDSRFPLDPETFSNNADNPTDRKALDKTDDLRALMDTQRNALSVKGGGKQGTLERFMPIIIIAGFVIIGYFLYTMKQNQDLLGLQGNVTQQQIQNLQRSLGK